MPIAYSMASYWVHKQVHIQMSAWIASQRGMNTRVCGEICALTQKAMGVMVPDIALSVLQWIPLSQTEDIEACDGIHDFTSKRTERREYGGFQDSEDEASENEWREYWRKQQQKKEDDANKTRYEKEAQARNEKFRKEREEREQTAKERTDRFKQEYARQNAEREAEARDKREQDEHERKQRERERNRTTGSSAGSSDPYQVLGITRQATQDEINTAYKLKIRALHPDMNPARIDSDVAELLNKKSAAINAAWELLKR